MAMRIIFPAKADLLSVESDEPVIRDGDRMCVASEVAKNGQWATEGGFGIDHPAPEIEATQELGKLFPLLEDTGRSCTTELFLLTETLETGDELAPKDLAQDGGGQEKVLFRGHPALVIRRETAGRNHAMDMWMAPSSRTIP
jgi:hypothetical protein